LDKRVEVYPGISYSAFLVPGLVMMSILQNAFANASSSLIQSKMTGNVVFILLPPLSQWEFFAAYVLAAIVRGAVVGTGVLLVTMPFYPPAFSQPVWIVIFAITGSAVLGTCGLLAAILADKIDQVSAFQNFIIMPLTFLSGVFYSIHSLPPFWQGLSHFNPVFYMIDGFRHGFFGVSDIAPWRSFGVVLTCLIVVSALTMSLLARGYKLRH
jgi:ABC-2 type transport system permease protein